MSLYQLHPHRSLESPVLLLATESWVDAGFGARAAIAQILETIPTEVLATFNADELIDYRARHPTARISDGVVAGLDWPEIQLLAGQDPAGRHVLILVGPEPDLSWHTFVRDVVDLATQLGVRLVVGVGAYPAPVPHTRPAGAALPGSHALPGGQRRAHRGADSRGRAGARLRGVACGG